MTESEKTLEDVLVETGKTAPRVRPQDLDNEIDPLVPPRYHRFPGTTVTVCCLTTLSGYNLVGSSAAVSIENFDEQIGRDVAYKNAREKLWALLGFRLSCELAAREVEVD